MDGSRIIQTHKRWHIPAWQSERFYR